MIKCSDCGANQDEGILFCSECGGFLLVEPGKITAVLPFSEFANRPPPPLTEEALTPTAAERKITLVVPGSRRRVTAAAVCHCRRSGVPADRRL